MSLSIACKYWDAGDLLYVSKHVVIKFPQACHSANIVTNLLWTRSTYDGSADSLMAQRPSKHQLWQRAARLRRKWFQLTRGINLFQVTSKALLPLDGGCSATLWGFA